MSYNGWTNYETWNLNLWVTNEEKVYRMMQDWKPFTIETAQSFTTYAYPFGTPDMDGPGCLEKVNWQEIIESWNED